jgi:hypothetical protein
LARCTRDDGPACLRGAQSQTCLAGEVVVAVSVRASLPDPDFDCWHGQRTLTPVARLHARGR